MSSVARVCATHEGGRRTKEWPILSLPTSPSILQSPDWGAASLLFPGFLWETLTRHIYLSLTPPPQSWNARPGVFYPVWKLQADETQAQRKDLAGSVGRRERCARWETPAFQSPTGILLEYVLACATVHAHTHFICQPPPPFWKWSQAFLTPSQAHPPLLVHWGC